jgi:hypothetical protein
MVLDLMDICSGIRTAENLVSDADSKVKQHQDTFNKLRSALQERAVIHTEVTALRVLDAVGDLCEFSELRPFPRLTNFALSWRNET